MLRCVDTFSEIPALFPRGVFELAAWRAYAQATLEAALPSLRMT